MFILLVAATPAIAQRPVPWVGGASVETEFERYAGQVTSELARRPVRVMCNGQTDWTHLAAQQRFDAITVWGYVLFTFDASTEQYRPVDYVQLSERACWYLDQYWQAPNELKGKDCKIATRIEFKKVTKTVRVAKRVRVKGKWVTKFVLEKRTQEVPVETPEYATCADYQNRVFALQTLGHEAMHLAGIADESQAECQGMQRIVWVAQRFGATTEQAKQMARDYYTDFYMRVRPGTPYYLPGCPNPAP